jgi:uncharacterized protein YbjT (DUF2867 family)
MRVAVAGGTGVVGRYVVEAAQERGDDVVILSRSRGIDLRTGDGLDAALDGVEAIVEVTNASGDDRADAAKFFTQVALSLHTAGSRHGIRHLVSLSIVGIDRATANPYYAAKLRQEEATLGGPVPATVLRATQFHEFAAQTLRRNRHGTTTVVPRMRIRPVAARTVGRVLVELMREPARRGLAPDLGGPEEADLATLVSAFAARFGIDTHVTESDPTPGVPLGATLPSTGARFEGPTFDEWLTTPDAARMLPASS